MNEPSLPPFARYLHPLEAAKFARQGRHCDVRRCSEPVVIYGWYYHRDRDLHRLIGHGRELCTSHGEAFAGRHHLVLEPAPRLEDVPREHIESPRAGRASLGGMGAELIAEHDAHGWTCDMPRCQEPARYLSGLNYATRSGQARHLSRFLCDRHALSFAKRQSIDMAAVRPPEVSR
jgi:hypothetical protein